MKLSKARAPGYRLLVRLKPLEVQKEVRSGGGIVLETKTDSQIKREQLAMTKAYVISVGSSCWFDVGNGEPWCEPGDCILLNQYSGKVLEEDISKGGELYRVINDRDVMLIYPDEKLSAEDLNSEMEKI